MISFSTTPRPTFGRKPRADEKTPGRAVVRVEARRAAMVESAKDVLGYLPAENEAVHLLLPRRLDLAVILSVLIEKLGPATDLHCSTLSLNARSLTELLRIADAPSPPRITALISSFFAAHSPALVAELRHEFRKRGHRVAAARNHTKIVCLRFESRKRLIACGSCNLRASGNAEQLSLTAESDGTPGGGLYDFFSAWITSMVDQHEGDADAE